MNNAYKPEPNSVLGKAFVNYKESFNVLGRRRDANHRKYLVTLRELERLQSIPLPGDLDDAEPSLADPAPTPTHAPPAAPEPQAPAPAPPAEPEPASPTLQPVETATKTPKMGSNLQTPPPAPGPRPLRDATPTPVTRPSTSVPTAASLATPAPVADTRNPRRADDRRGGQPLGIESKNMYTHNISRAALLALAFSILAGAQATYDPALWSGMRYRMIGPERGGRVTAVTGVASEPYTFYMGSTGGGVWKTTDAGHTWTNVSDGFFSAASMGAIEVSLSNPNVVYAGTGSSKIRSNVSIGRGIYKSIDAGKTWTFLGLRDVGQIATVRVHPSNPDIVYVAASGNPFVPNKERGVYRSTDGGKTWKQVFFLSDSAGAADLELQPGNPNVIFACMWHGQRKPWTIVSGAREGGIYKSTNGGDTWTKLAGGLPNDLFGRSNVAISAASPNRVYALIEAKPGSGLYRSEDAGATWSLVNGSANIITRPFYYTTLGVDPNHPDVVWVGDEGWFKSTDGGKTFRTSPIPHGDNHDVWINPRNSDYMIQGNDGGANVSLDGGRTWSTQSNQPTAEIYQVAVDNQYPYRVYGAQQDNTTVIVPSLATGNGQDFRVGPGCETGPIMPDKDNPEIVYG